MASTLGRLALSTAAKRLAVQSIRVKTLPMVLSVRACMFSIYFKILQSSIVFYIFKAVGYAIINLVLIHEPRKNGKLQRPSTT